MSEEPQQPPPTVTGVRRFVYLTLAAVFFVLGATGAIVLGLPTTPFLLLTSYFLLRTSPQLNEKLLNSRFFGPILTDWQRRGGVRRHIKLKAAIVVVIAISLTLYFSPFAPVWKWAIAACGLIGLTVVLRLPEVQTTTADRTESEPRTQ